MKKSNLISFLKRLAPQEIRELGYYIRSPFFNRNKSIIKLYEYLSKQYPEFESGKTEKKYVYSRIFETAEYNDGFMRVLISNLTKLTEEYLTQVNFKSRPQTKKLFLLNELNLRKLEKEFKAGMNDTRKLFASFQPNTMHYFFDKAMLEDNIYFYNSWRAGSKKRNKELDEKSLKSIIDNFTKFYLIACITMYRKVLYINNYGKIDIDLNFTEQILKVLEQFLDDFRDTPIISLYANEVFLMTKGDRKYYETLKKIFMNESHGLSYTDIYSLNNILQRYLTKQSLTGKHDYAMEKFNLYQTAVSRNNILLPYAKNIDEHLFISIVKTALSSGNILWAENFIKDHNHLLKDEKKHSVLELCRAAICMESGGFEEALTYLRSVKTKSTELRILIKIILLKIYFELSNYSEAELAIDSARHLLTKSEKQISPLIFESYRNFLRYYSIVIKAKEKNKKEKMRTIADELKKNPAVEEYKWLFNKAKDTMASLKGH